MQYHFSMISDKYRSVRTTDLEPIIFIKKKLQKYTKIAAADVGCGAGRYGLKFLKYFGKRLFLYCIDANKHMLKALTKLLIKHNIKKFKPLVSSAGKIPLKDNSLDCILTFNAVHHFKILKFLKESSRILKDGGHLFIYTRLRTQNSKTIWGKYFPLFNKKETRLYELNELKKIFKKTHGLEIESIKYFKYARLSSLNKLLVQVQTRHYSTFCLYSKKEFKQSLETFKQNISHNFKNLNKISWFDENILLIVRKQIN